MCGLVGNLSNEPAMPILSKILNKLEMRGYDSYGFVTFLDNGTVEDEIKGLGPSSTLNIDCLGNFKAKTGMAHTRWSTNGVVSTKNTCPIKVGDWYVCLNGIIENYKTLKDSLIYYGYSCKTDTDTEVIPCLLDLWCSFSDKGLEYSLQGVCDALMGEYAFIAMSPKYPDTILAACHGSPIYISSKGYISSDIQSLQSLDTVCFKLEDDKPTIITNQTLKEYYYNIEIPKEVDKKVMVGDHMLSEIEEQTNLKIKDIKLDEHKEIVLFACGSSYYAAKLGQYYLEEISKVRCSAYYASDLQYHNLDLFDEDTLFICITQSGETKDSLLMLDRLKDRNTLVITNSPQSQATRLAEQTIFLDCGPELAVASTKTFTASVLTLLHLAEEVNLDELLGAFKEVLDQKEKIKEWANHIKDYEHVLFLARYINFPIAQEAALKLKEVSYIHAEAIQAAEIKHGPIALIDDKTLSIFIMGGDNKGGQDKIFNNIEQIKARNGKVLVITNSAWETSVKLHNDDVLVVPTVDKWLQPLVFAVVGQLLAYYCAKLKSLNPNFPRNLAKTITV